MNLTKGLDRIAILLAIPTIFWGAYHSYNEYIDSKEVRIHITLEEENELKDSYRALPGKKDQEEDITLTDDLNQSTTLSFISHSARTTLYGKITEN